MDIFAFSDIHGQKELFDKIYTWLNGRSAPWKCYFLGDACDRRDGGYEIIKMLLNDERFVYLKGNHEDLFVRAAKAFGTYMKMEQLTSEEVAANPYEHIIAHHYNRDINLHIQNGGLKTLMDWVVDGSPLDIIERLDCLPEHITLPHEVWGTLDLSHSGHLIDESDSFIWSRDHFQEKWEGGRMIHGHTPVRSLGKYTFLEEEFNEIDDLLSSFKQVIYEEYK